MKNIITLLVFVGMAIIANCQITTKDLHTRISSGTSATILDLPFSTIYIVEPQKSTVRLPDLTGDQAVEPGFEMYDYGYQFENFRLSQGGYLSFDGKTMGAEGTRQKAMAADEIEVTRVALYQMAAKYAVVRNRVGELLCLTFAIELSGEESRTYFMYLPDVLDDLAKQGTIEASTIKAAVFGKRI